MFHVTACVCVAQVVSHLWFSQLVWISEGASRNVTNLWQSGSFDSPWVFSRGDLADGRALVWSCQQHKPTRKRTRAHADAIISMRAHAMGGVCARTYNARFCQNKCYCWVFYWQYYIETQIYSAKDSLSWPWPTFWTFCGVSRLRGMCVAEAKWILMKKQWHDAFAHTDIHWIKEI